MDINSLTKEEKIKIFRGPDPDEDFEDLPDDEFDIDELEMGIEFEMEHTNDEDIAKIIAKDHLSEIPDYYTRLEKMEKKARKEWDNEEL